MHSFNLIQSVEGPTHLKGHALDIVISYGLIFDSLELSELLFLRPSSHFHLP